MTSSKVFYKLKIQYNGFSYHGFQIQKGSREKTIQGELEKAFLKIGNTEIKLIGSGRTDAGVHALGQVVRADATQDIPPDKLTKALNSNLPFDIEVIESDYCEDEFSPIRDALSKTYSYVIYNGKSKLALHYPLMTQVGYQLDWGLIEKGLDIYKGKHDFKNFYTVGTPVNSTIREIFDVGIERSFSILKHPDLYIINFKGNGFLKQMVRLMVGGLIELGRGRVTIEDLEDCLAVSREFRLGPVAPSNGLYLKEVEYPS